jgi:hypothetical protein
MIRATVILLSGILAAGVAAAQSPPPRQQAPNMPAPNSTIPEKIRPQDPSATGSLSERLGASDGVVKPRGDIDPHITAPAPVPDPGTTRVIPPPGSPGGDQSIEPK